MRVQLVIITLMVACLAPGALAACQGNSCLEQQQAARAAGLLGGSLGTCQSKTYPSTGTLPVVSAAEPAPAAVVCGAPPPAASAAGSFSAPAVHPTCHGPRLQVTLPSRLTDLKWAAGLNGSVNDKVREGARERGMPG